MVEFALILPVIALLLVMAVDFGRVFFGWVAVNNAARVAAGYAAANGDAWALPNTPEKAQRRNLYAVQLVQDANAIGCTPRYTTATAPAPTFNNRVGSASPFEIGDEVVVTLQCSFGLITPLAERVAGGPVSLRTDSTFVVRSGAVVGLPTPNPSASPSPSPSPSATATASPTGSASASASPTAIPTPSPSPCPLPIANFAANPTRGKAPVTVTFNDTSQTFGCAVTGWQWSFGDGTTSTLQNPTHTYTADGNYDVNLTVTSPGGTNSTRVNNYIKVDR